MHIAKILSSLRSSEWQYVLIGVETPTYCYDNLSDAEHGEIIANCNA